MSHSQVALDPSNSALSSDINRVSLAVKAVHGNYTEWSDWSDCSTSCGSGEKFRTRNCTNPPPAFGGMDCSFVGMDRDVQKCEKRACAGEYCAVLLLMSGDVTNVLFDSPPQIHLHTLLFCPKETWTFFC